MEKWRIKQLEVEVGAWQNPRVCFIEFHGEDATIITGKSYIIALSFLALALLAKTGALEVGLVSA